MPLPPARAALVGYIYDERRRRYLRPDECPYHEPLPPPPARFSLGHPDLQDDGLLLEGMAVQKSDGSSRSSSQSASLAKKLPTTKFMDSSLFSAF